MKSFFKKILVFVLSFLLVFTSAISFDFVSLSSVVYADDGVSFSDFIVNSVYTLLARAGVVVSSDFASYVASSDFETDLEEAYIEEYGSLVDSVGGHSASRSGGGHWMSLPDFYTTDDGYSYYYTSSFWNSVSELLEEYASSTQPYEMVEIINFEDYSASAFGSYGTTIYGSLVNLFEENGSGYMFVFARDGILSVFVPDSCDYSAFVSTSNPTWSNAGFFDFVYLYNYLSITTLGGTCYTVYFDSEYYSPVSSLDDIVELAEAYAEDDSEREAYVCYVSSPSRFIVSWDSVYYPYRFTSSYTNYLFNSQLASSSHTHGYEAISYNRGIIMSYSLEYVRVFDSVADAQDYSVSGRSVYYTENYYNYEYNTTNYTVSTDELEEAVDNMNATLDALLEVISDDTSEREIMDLLQQIIDAINNSGSSSSDSGSSSSDSSTSEAIEENSSILSSILDQLETMDSNMDSWFDGIGDSLSDLGQSITDSFTLLDETLDSWFETLAAAISEQTESIVSAIDGLSSDLSEDDDSSGWFSSWLSFLGSFLGSIASAVVSLVESLTSSVETVFTPLKSKFPFSLPWDIMILVGLLQSEPEAPVLELPLAVDSFGINETIVVDLSPFESVAKLSRLLLSLLYIYFLINMTFKVLGIGKEAEQ